MDNTILVAILSFIGTIIGTFGGILTANKLTNYRLTQIEKKIEQNTLSYEHIAVELCNLRTSYEVCSVKICNLEKRLNNIEKLMEGKDIWN